MSRTWGTVVATTMATAASERCRSISCQPQCGARRRSMHLPLLPRCMCFSFTVQIPSTPSPTSSHFDLLGHARYLRMPACSPCALAIRLQPTRLAHHAKRLRTCHAHAQLILHYNPPPITTPSKPSERKMAASCTAFSTLQPWLMPCHLHERREHALHRCQCNCKALPDGMPCAGASHRPAGPGLLERHQLRRQPPEPKHSARRRQLGLTYDLARRAFSGPVRASSAPHIF